MGKVKCGIGVGTRVAPPDVAEFGHVVDLLEQHGFDSLWLSDRATTGSLDPVSALAFAAGRTRKLKLGTSTLVVPGRNPVLLARELATVDALSGGRLLPAFGLGTVHPGEQEAFGVRRNERGGWFDEAVPLMQRLWREDSVTHAGARFTVTGLNLRPKPVGRMQVWTGGRSDREYDRTGRLAEGWLGSFQTPGEAGEARRAIEQACDRHGRAIDDDHYGMVLLYARDAIADPVRAMVGRVRPELTADDLIPAGADGLARAAAAYLGDGISKFVFIPTAPPASWEDELAWLAPIVRDIEALG
jgi:probable F420-dependent oxidoreductase